MAFVTQNSRLSAAEQRLGPQGGRGTFTRRNINNDPRAASGRSGREQDENPSRGTAPTIFQGVTTVQANRNRSSRLIDVGGEPIGQLRVTPANPPTSEIQIVKCDCSSLIFSTIGLAPDPGEFKVRIS